MRFTGYLGGLGAAVLASAAVACAHNEVSPETIARAEGASRAAQEAGANNVPTAAVFLKVARDEMEEARRLSKKNDERATMLYMRAKADAEMALALAQEKTIVSEALALRNEGASHENR